MAKDTSISKFDATVEAHIRLGVDPRHAEQMVRGSVVLPNGTGKKVQSRRVRHGRQGEREATEAGADFVGGDDLVKKVSEGWTDFDAAVATPDIMSKVGPLGKILGPRGLMPNPKSGTVTFDVARAVREVKGGKVEFRTDKFGIVHAPIGKVSFDRTAPEPRGAGRRSDPQQADDLEGPVPADFLCGGDAGPVGAGGRQRGGKAPHRKLGFWAMYGPVIQGNLARLRPPTSEDAAVMIAWFEDMEVTRLLMLRNPPSIEMEKEWLDRAARNPDEVLWVVEHSGAAIGTTHIHLIDWKNGFGTTGRSSVTTHSGEGLGRE